MQTLKDYLDSYLPERDEDLIITGDTSAQDIITQLLEWQSLSELAEILLANAKTDFTYLSKINRYHSYDISKQYDIMNDAPVTNLIKPSINGEYVKFENVNELLEIFETVFKLAKLAQINKDMLKLTSKNIDRYDIIYDYSDTDMHLAKQGEYVKFDDIKEFLK